MFKINFSDFVSQVILCQVKNLYVSFFEILEDLRKDNYINDEVYQSCRKKVLDRSNMTLRGLDTQLKNIDFSLKTEDNK